MQAAQVARQQIKTDPAAVVAGQQVAVLGQGRQVVHQAQITKRAAAAVVAQVVQVPRQQLLIQVLVVMVG